MAEPIIVARGVRFTYPDGTGALTGVDFTLHAGEAVAVIGGNGSGKTTFVETLVGIHIPEGELMVAGIPVRPERLAEVRRRAGLVMQDADSQLFMGTVLDDVTFGPLAAGLSEKEALARARHALEQVGMAAAEAKAPFHLSAGEKRRVAIAGVLATEPDLLVLDEPTTYLDPPGQRELAALLTALPQAKLIVTHDMRFARAVCTRGVFFSGGRIVGDTTIEEIVRRFGWEM
ncbi:MAG: ABC transporter ATP-binding protein [Acidobacteria bacterium]|nr:ABC transporter ATP-binding protein [Acidobacteriota bacterium]